MAERLVVVTGGGRGIGRAVCERFVADGCRVVAVGRDERALDETVTSVGGAGEVVPHVCDVTDESAVAELFERFSPVDALVANAGASTSASLHRTSLAQWHAQLAVNATGAFLCTRAVLGSMRERGDGRIVTVASTAGITGSPYTAAYTASKHAAIGLMRVAAAELAGSGATANAVCPSFVRTEMTERTIARIADQTGRGEHEALADLLAASPLGRLLEPEEVAAAVAFLASAQAASINGEALVLDGGELNR